MHVVSSQPTMPRCIYGPSSFVNRCRCTRMPEAIASFRDPHAFARRLIFDNAHTERGCYEALNNIVRGDRWFDVSYRLQHTTLHMINMHMSLEVREPWTTTPRDLEHRFLHTTRSSWHGTRTWTSAVRVTHAQREDGRPNNCRRYHAGHSFHMRSRWKPHGEDGTTPSRPGPWTTSLRATEPFANTTKCHHQMLRARRQITLRYTPPSCLRDELATERTTLTIRILATNRHRGLHTASRRGTLHERPPRASASSPWQSHKL